ncbi:exosome complex exonuclease RRP40 [Thraustotheca clavata]|uniref:Ribosomal RNA-processing protein 40 n=1 Tax=Thraustotheca clavata TaxID=74557 RepID=A0A1W0A9P5_9STRA|nr:exosome complex exonuclease RRP40 [Thraustotheca clavata]
MAEEFLLSTEQSIDLSFKPLSVLPGDDVTTSIANTNQKLRLGAGLVASGTQVLATNAGVLRYRPPNRYWIDFNHKRYIPSMDDGVVGVIVDRNAEFYRLDIGASTYATLGMLAFDGASKRNRPNLQPGSLVYCRVASANQNLEPSLTCEAPSHMTKKDWMTGLALYGELNGGYVLKTSIGLAKSLLKDECVVLSALGRAIPFEIAVGFNGIIWVNSGTCQDTILITNAILNSEGLPEAQVEAMVDKLISEYKR